MIGSRKRRLLPIALTCVVLVGAIAWSLRPRSTVCRTPAECLEAYHEARRAGDAVRYRRCLGEPLQSQVRKTYPDDEALAESLRLEGRGIKGWADVGAPDEQGGRAIATVEEVRETGQRRLRFYLEHSPEGWLIVRIERGAEQAPDVRYGTRAGEETAAP
jgi:hypothetical protein